MQTPKQPKLSDLAAYVAELGIEPEDVYTNELFYMAVSANIEDRFIVEADKCQRGAKWLA